MLSMVATEIAIENSPRGREKATLTSSFGQLELGCRNFAEGGIGHFVCQIPPEGAW
jgi:hypothetical protein